MAASTWRQGDGLWDGNRSPGQAKAPPLPEALLESEGGPAWGGLGGSLHGPGEAVRSL
jgi:hypothetical protein